MNPKWQIPEWMRPYLEALAESGSGGVDQLMNASTSSGDNVVQWAREHVARGKVRLLEVLHEKGMLREAVAEKEKSEGTKGGKV